MLEYDLCIAVCGCVGVSLVFTRYTPFERPAAVSAIARAVGVCMPFAALIAALSCLSFALFVAPGLIGGVLGDSPAPADFSFVFAELA